MNLDLLKKVVPEKFSGAVPIIISLLPKAKVLARKLSVLVRDYFSRKNIEVASNEKDTSDLESDLNSRM